MNIDWDMMDALANMIQAIIVVVALPVALRQLRLTVIQQKTANDQRQEAANIRTLEAFLTVSSELNSQESRASRRFIYTHLRKMTEAELRSLPEKQFEQVERVCVTFDRLGVLIKKKLMPEEVALSMYFESILKTWYSTQLFIQGERAKRKYPTHYTHFEWLNQRCEVYAKKRDIIIEVQDH